jgi:hypothetical protein
VFVKNRKIVGLIPSSLFNDRRQRYQTAKDLLLDLQDLKEQIDLEAKLKHLRPSGPEMVVPAVSAPKPVETIAQPSGGSTSPMQITSALKLRRRGVVLALAIFLVLLAGMLLYALLFRKIGL